MKETQAKWYRRWSPPTKEVPALLFLLVLLAGSLSTTDAFTSSSNALSKRVPSRALERFKATALKERNDGESILDRFVNPRIDDPWLPLNEAGVAQGVAPTLQLRGGCSVH